VWGDAQVRAGNLGQAGRLELGELQRHVGLAGITFRPAQKVTTNFDYEGSPGNHTYFRTSLDQYHRLRARVRWQFLKDLSLAGQYHFLDNQNPNPAAKYDYRSQEASASLLYAPNGGKRISFLGEYSRSSLHSDITYLDPTDLQRARSYYRDYGHSLTSLVDLSLPKIKLSVGGSAFLSSGSRPTDYYQPLMRLAVPIQKHINWKSEWRYFGLSETFYRYEGFRAHLFITGLQIVR
jgi:hypothetical protein